jgi:hypothetical protein
MQDWRTFAQRNNSIADVTTSNSWIPGHENARLHSPCSYPLIAFFAGCPSARGAVSRSMVVRDLRHSGLQAHSVSLLLRRLWAPQLRWSRARARALEPLLCLPFLVGWNAKDSIFVLCRRDVLHARNGWNGVVIGKLCQCVVNDRVWVRESSRL